jgi:DNA-binding HxlR family transcriptional regulator
MALLDLLGRRMALRALWELRQSSLAFRQLQAAAETNPSVINARRKELREAGIVVHGPEGYGLTPTGRQLRDAFLPLQAWSDDWARRLKTGARPATPRKTTCASRLRRLAHMP